MVASFDIVICWTYHKLGESVVNSSHPYRLGSRVCLQLYFLFFKSTPNELCIDLAGYQINPSKKPSLDVIKVNFPVIIKIPKSTRIAPLIFWIWPMYFVIFENILKNPFMAKVVSRKGDKNYKSPAANTISKDNSGCIISIGP